MKLLTQLELSCPQYHPSPSSHQNHQCLDCSIQLVWSWFPTVARKFTYPDSWSQSRWSRLWLEHPGTPSWSFRNPRWAKWLHQRFDLIKISLFPFTFLPSVDLSRSHHASWSSLLCLSKSIFLTFISQSFIFTFFDKVIRKSAHRLWARTSTSDFASLLGLACPWVRTLNPYIGILSHMSHKLVTKLLNDLGYQSGRLFDEPGQVDKSNFRKNDNFLICLMECRNSHTSTTLRPLPTRLDR